MSKLYYFNPEHDLAIANGNSHFQAPESAIALADDLSLLPCWYADEASSVVLSDQSFSDDVNVLNLDIKTIPLFSSDKIEELMAEPWGWDMAVRQFFIQNGVSDNMLLSPEAIESYKQLSHRRLASEAMDYLRSRSSFPASMPMPAREFSRLSDIVDFSEENYEIVLKAPWSGSGRGVFWSHGPLTPSISGWCRRVIDKQGSVMGEVAYNRVQDFAMEFRISGGEVSFAGYSLFFTEGNGIYRGNYLMSNQAIEAQLTQWVSVDYLDWIKNQLCDFLRGRVSSVYNGFVGVDMFVYEEDDEFRVNPVVEFNMRMTMGLVARLIFDRYIDYDSKGFFAIDHLPPGQMLLDHKHKMKENPVSVFDGRFRSGYFSLCPVSDNTIYRASITLE